LAIQTGSLISLSTQGGGIPDNMSLKGLTGKKSLKTEKKLSINGITINAPGYKIQNEFIWGATAMILSEFTEIMSESLQDYSITIFL
jgi:hypothetical protein